MKRTNQRVFRLFILSTGISVTLIFVFFPAIIRPMMRRAYRNAVPQHGTASVVMLAQGNSELLSGREYNSQVLVRFRNELHNVRVPSEKMAFFRPNQEVDIVYRVGLGGRIYVDSISPLPASPPGS